MSASAAAMPIEGDVNIFGYYFHDAGADILTFSEPATPSRPIRRIGNRRSVGARIW